jgi:exonuclease III
MKILSWNIRGLNAKRKQDFLKDRIKKDQPDILLLQETKCAGIEANITIQRCWKQAQYVEVDANGAAGGFAILWNPTTVLLDNFFTSKWTITASFRLIGSNKQGYITNVYGPPRPGDKEAFLQHLEWIAEHLGTQRWILGGDFNMITGLEEKKGGHRSLGNDNINFNDTIGRLKLIDVGTDNGMFTWSNRRSGAQHISCRLDRFLISEAIMMDGLAWNATVIDTPGSDHWPILLTLNITGTPGRKPFRFEKFWLKHPDFQTNIKTWWEEAAIQTGTPMYRFQQRLKNLKQHLKSWNKSTFGDIFQAQENLKQQMQTLQQQIRSQGLTEDLKTQETLLNNQIAERRAQEEVLWRQKSRIQWLKEGEKNTKFFHRSMIQRRQTNRITHLVSAQGTEIQQHEDMEKELLTYYQTLLTEPPTDRSQAIESILKNIPKEVTKEKNEALMRPITQEEVDQSLKDTQLGKAPGPDGFTSDFFHYCWSIIREEVWEIIEDSRKSGKVLQALNATFLTLIPKENNSTSPSQFRPIALCNVIYKLLTKIIATRLKPILPFLISPEQSGYVEGRQIMDSVILAHEVIHSLHSTKTPGMLLKLDLSKAFDKLSWNYLRSSLLAFGFDPAWVSWIVNLTSSALFSILINGVPSKPFSPSRGIRQGDPLSPFLFILLAEGLSRTIKASHQGPLSLWPHTPWHFSPHLHSQFM